MLPLFNIQILPDHFLAEFIIIVKVSGFLEVISLIESKQSNKHLNRNILITGNFLIRE